MPTSPPRRSGGPSPYERLDLTGVHLPPLVAVGVHGREAMLQTARDLGYPQRTVTPALTRFSRVYVIQLGGDPDAGTVALAESLSAVLHVCDRQHAIGQATAPVRVVTEALAPPLNAFLKPWTDSETDTESDPAAAEPLS